LESDAFGASLFEFGNFGVSSVGVWKLSFFTTSIFFISFAGLLGSLTSVLFFISLLDCGALAYFACFSVGPESLIAAAVVFTFFYLRGYVVDIFFS
jgi:hypothetical protein